MIKKLSLLTLIMASLSYCKEQPQKSNEHSSTSKAIADNKYEIKKPTLKLEKTQPFSLTGANSLESAFKTTDARYVEYYVCESGNSNNCAPSKDKPKSVPAKLGSISTSSSIRGEVELTARACNYIENTRSAQKSCSEWQNTKINIPNDKNDKLSKKLKERETLITQKSDLCPDFIDAINKKQKENDLDKKEKEILKAISDQSEDYCRFLMESAAGVQINRELKDKNSPLYKKIQSSVKKEQQTLSLSESGGDSLQAGAENKKFNAADGVEVLTDVGIFMMAVSGLVVAYNSFAVASIGGMAGLKYSSGKFLKYGIGGFVAGAPIALITLASLSGGGGGGGSSGSSGSGGVYHNNTLIYVGHDTPGLGNTNKEVVHNETVTEKFKKRHKWAKNKKLGDGQIKKLKNNTSWVKGSGFTFGFGAAFLAAGQIWKEKSQSLAEDPNFSKLQKVNKKYEDINLELEDNKRAIQKIIEDKIDKKQVR